MTKKKLRIIPLGGCGEVGKNMTVLEYGGEALVIDVGIMFPEGDMPGIDYIIPDFNYLEQKTETVKGIVFTHGHEDHIGAVGHAMDAFDAPIYATPFTRALVEIKLKRARLLDGATLHTIEPGKSFTVGPFKVEPFHVCHSIPDCVGLGINTPVGLVVHTGDYKFDHTPVDGNPPDFAKIAELGKRGVLALLSDSTNADLPGATPSEAVVTEAFDAIFRTAKGRVIVATFASLIARIQQAADIAQRYKRKIAIAGYTMTEYVRIARDMGYLRIPPDQLISLEQADAMDPSKVVIVATGAQGESNAVLGRLAFGRHDDLEVKRGDTVIMSANFIPGNEEKIHGVINRLYQRGANVIYPPIAPVHVSGHAKQEDHKLLINLIRPKFFVPVSGELRHLHQHAGLAAELGIPRDHIAVVENGTVLDFDGQSMTVGERVPGGYVFVDGATVGDVGPAVMRDRAALSRDGFLIVMVNVDQNTGKVLDEPVVISRGFVFMREADELMEQIKQVVYQAMDDECAYAYERGACLESVLSKAIYQMTRRRPMVFSLVNQL
ncbi:MAG: ribonuclease J [Anaerolineae bacterium]|nr:ribonuclease J [Anaerolineae bacterium]